MRAVIANCANDPAKVEQADGRAIGEGNGEHRALGNVGHGRDVLECAHAGRPSLSAA